jgi:VCBS repeat-containing protein
VANNDSYSVQENTALTVVAPGVLGNDTGGSGTLTATEVKGPASGTLTLNSNGSFTYTPNTGFSGTDSFTYTATDGVNTSAPATVTITVTSTSGVLFSDTFPGTSLSPFVTESGTWSVANNVLSGTCAVYGYGYAYLSTNWTDYSVQAQLTFPAGAWGGGIGGRLNATTGAHYGVWVYPENSGGGSAVVKVIKFEGWTTWGGTAMATANVTSVGTTAHTLLVSFQGSTITVSYDGTQEISVTDNNFDSVAAYTSGGITVDMSAYPAAYTMSVQDVVVQSLP